MKPRFLRGVRTTFVCRRKLSPIEAGLSFDSVLVVAEQAADHVPTVAAAYFNIALQIHPHKALIGQAGFAELIGLYLVGAQQMHQLGAA